MGQKKLVLTNRSVILVLFALMTIFFVSSANAEIYLSQPNSYYNLGEELILEVNSDSVISGYFDIDLECEVQKISIYHNVPDSKAFNIKRPLTSEYIGNLSGNCNLVGSYDIFSKTTSSFEISRELSVLNAVEKATVEAGKSITIKGTAIKRNNKFIGQIYPASVDAIINEQVIASSPVKDGQFEVAVSTQETMRAGSYALKLRVQDYDSKQQILNSGEALVDLIVTQKPAKIEIAIDKQTMNPGQELSITPFLYDLAGDLVNDKMLIQIRDSDSKKIYEGYVNSNENIALKTSTNDASGLWSITAQKEDITTEKNFEVLTLKKINAKIINESMIVTNVGNVPYKGLVEFQIAGEKILKNINLGLNEIVEYALSAPDGVYTISVKDSDVVFSKDGVALTGNAISISDVKNKLGNIWINYPIMWIFIILVLAGSLWAIYKRYIETKRLRFSTLFERRKPNPEITKKGGVEIIRPEKVVEDIVQGEIRKAEQVTVLHGQKSQAGVVAIKIKNGVGGISQHNLNYALEYGYRMKGVSYTSGDYVILLFTPLMTRNNKNEETAIKVALDIDGFLKEHNRKFRNDIINYGIGVNSGEIINKMAGKVLQFAVINKTINHAKRIAEVSNQEALLSREIHEKTANSIKADRFTAGSMDLFIVKRIVDKEKSEKFIQGFLRRNTTK